MVASGQLRKLAKHTRAGRYRRVARCLDRLVMKRPEGDDAAAAAGAVAHYRDEAGQSLLHLAAADGHARLIRTFADLGCSLTSRDAHGNTPAHLVLYHCLQTGRSPAYAERLLANLSSSASLWQSLAGLANASGATCRGLLERLEADELAASAAVDAALADAAAAADSADEDDEKNWRRRLADAAAEDAGDAADGVDDGEDDGGLPAFETLDDWFSRIGREYAERRRRQQQQQQQRRPQKQRQVPQEQLQLQLQLPQETETLDAYTRHKDAYLAFFQAPPDSPITGVCDVPWPPFLGEAGNAEPAAVLRALQASGLPARSELRQLRVLWHPDKFLQKFGHRLMLGCQEAAAAREAVLRRVTLASQLVNGAMALLLAAADGASQSKPP